MSLSRAARRAIPGLSTDVQTKKYGFPLKIESPHAEWKTVLETWMPRLKKVGWLDGLLSMEIGRGAPVQGSGQYKESQIWIEHRRINEDAPVYGIVETSARGVLIHEVLHHAHNFNIDFETSASSLTDTEKTLLIDEVSSYAAMNRYEAVAEIGTGLCTGKNYSPEIMHIYEKYNGPEEVHEIREMC